MKRLLITSVLATATLVPAVSVQAATIVVDTELDVVAEDGLCSLREAITNANTNSQSGSADCAAGAFDSNIIAFDPSLANATITLGGEQLPSLARILTIEGPVPGDPSGLILDGNLASRLIRVQGTGIESTVATLRDLTLAGGRTTGTSLDEGGAVRVGNASLILERVIVSQNSTAGNGARGGGLYGREARIELIDSVIEQNRTEGLGSPGGGVAVHAGELVLLRTLVRGNRTQGGGVSHGGGVWAGEWVGAGSEVSVTDSILADNAVEAGSNFGGGLAAEGSQVDIRRSTISGNAATAAGGGVRVSNGELVLINSTLSDNFCGSAGCGLQLARSAAAAVNSTIAFNRTTAGGARGISLFGTTDEPAALGLVNSLVVQASGSHTTCSANDHGTIMNIGSFSTHASCTGEATNVEDISLGPLADNGGITPTHALFPDSVVIGAAGDCGSDWGVTLDQRGEPRPGGDSTACDAGAFEVQANESETDLAISKSVSPETANPGGKVVFTLEAGNLGPDDATGVIVTDELPAGYLLVSATPDAGAYDEISGLWEIGALDAGDTATLTIEATVTGVDDYLNVATIMGGQFDPHLPNNTDQAEPSIVPPEADLAIVKEVLPLQADVGQPVTFTLTASNLGPDDATGVTVLDQLPAGYAFDSASASTGDYDETSGQWNIGTIEPGTGAVLIIEAIVTGFNDYLNTATITGDENDPEVSNNSDTATVTLPPPAEAIIVDTLQDVSAEDGACSLREAVINAVNGNQSGSADCEVANVIRFNESLIGGTIELNGSPLPTIDDHLSIEGPVSGDPGGLTLDGQGLSRIFNIEYDATVHLSDMTLTNGRTTGAAISGGAVRIFDGPDVTLSRLRLTGNVSQDSSGGAIHVHESRLTLIDSELSGNQSLPESGRGGAIDALDSLVFLDGTTVAENHAAGSGGGLNLTRSTLNAVNSTLSGNASGGSGGGINLDGAVATLTHTTVASNTAVSGGSGIYASASADFPVELSMFNSLAVDNHCHVSGGVNFTLVSAGSLSTAGGCVEGAATPSEAIDLLGLADNGGLTRTHALGAGSAAIGFAGNCPLDFEIEFDQRGEPRPGGGSGACDAGAFEFQGQNGDMIFEDRFEN